MDSPLIEKSDLRNISKVLSSSWVNDLVDDTRYKTAKKQLKTIIRESNFQITGNKIGDALNEIYTGLLTNYRNEYVYKNILLNTFVKEHHDQIETIILNEFQINKSKADVVTINGTSSVFEIKTELDSPLRLKTQINDYFKAFNHVYIVTHHSLINKYLPLLNNGEGLIILTSDLKYQTVIEASYLDSMLSIETMMKCLRKQEFTQVNLNLFQEIPNAKDIYLFDAILEQAQTISPLIYQREFLSMLKRRKLSEIDLFHSTNTPEFLKYICYRLDLSKNQYIRLLKNLNSKL